MAKTVIPLNSPVRLSVVAVVGLALIVGCAYAVVWGFANTIARNGKDKEFTEFAAGIAPSDPQARFANAFQIEKTFDLASIGSSLKEYEAAVALSPRNFFYWLALGQARERDGDRAGGETAFREALELAPNYARTRWALGNNLVRQGKTDEGFNYIRAAIAQDASFAVPAVSAATITFGDDTEQIITALGQSPSAVAELAKRFAAENKMDAALSTWKRIPPDQRNEQMSETGKFLVGNFFQAKRFRYAAEVARSIAANPRQIPSVGEVTNGGFENGVVLQNADIFDWQIGAGIYPQIALTDRNAKEGKFALAILFNSPSNLEFRTVSKTVAVEPGKRYELSFAYRNETSTRAAFHWEIVSASDGKVLAASDQVASAGIWSESRTAFVVPASEDGVTVRLSRQNCASPQCTVAGNLFFDDFKLTGLN